MSEVRFRAPDQPGWSAISAGGVSALVRGGESDDVVKRVAESVRTGDLDDVLDALSAEGLRRAPDFVAVLDGDPVRVVARGTAYAVVSGPDGDLEFRAGRGPWTDTDAPAGATEVVLHSGEPLPEPEPEGLPDGELERPSAVKGWQLPARLRRGGPPREQQAPDRDQPEVQDVPGYDYLFGAPGSTGTPPFLGDHDTGSLSEPPIGRAPMEEAGGLDEASDHTLPPPLHTQQGRPDPASAPVPGTSGSTPAADPVAPAAAAGSRGSGSGLIESVPWRRGGSNVPPPEPASGPATSAPERDASAAPEPYAPEPYAPERDPSVAPEPAAPEPHAPVRAAEQPPAAPTGWGALPPLPSASEPVVGPVPPASAPRDSAPAPVAPEEAVEPEEATVDRASLPVTATGSIPRGPIVLAVLCPAGHPSPPHAVTCRVCDREIPPQQPFQAPRPPLGTIRLSSGDVVTLDRGVLLGRAPKLNADLPAADRPHLVRVVSAENDISRNHVEVVLEGWHVLVRDLGSTNGTTITLPGQQPVRLRPSDSQVIEPGTVVGMADEVTFTYEVRA
ncbi:FHA domain-containing protein [Pedococcus sp. NPDC057267]|uniref:FHA domain-containing protein n=1 Tax=Pedococcus sp. NPDC057267 TaxID=3346077 RepID=UPI003643129E